MPMKPFTTAWLMSSITSTHDALDPNHFSLSCWNILLSTTSLWDSNHVLGTFDEILLFPLFSSGSNHFIPDKIWNSDWYLGSTMKSASPGYWTCHTFPGNIAVALFMIFSTLLNRSLLSSSSFGQNNIRWTWFPYAHPRSLLRHKGQRSITSTASGSKLLSTLSFWRALLSSNILLNFPSPLTFLVWLIHRWPAMSTDAIVPLGLNRYPGLANKAFITTPWVVGLKVWW